MIKISMVFSSILRLIAYMTTALFTLFLLWGIGWMVYVTSVVSMKPQRIEQKTDAIVVLTGGDKRINTGIDLLKNRLADQLFISGVNPQVKPEDLLLLWNKDEKNKSYDNTVLLCCITLGYKAADTQTNATETRTWIKENNIHSIRLVTSNYHMARSYLFFHNAMADLVIYRHPVTPDDFTPWHKEFWVLAFEEYNKLIATWLRIDLLQKNPSLQQSANFVSTGK